MQITIAVDTAGGDHAPSAVLVGVQKAIERHIEAQKESSIHFLLFGKQDILDETLSKNSLLKKHSTVIGCDEFIADDATPSKVIRRAQNTSLGRAILAVRDLKANAVVSSGNTGTFMALSKMYLKTFKNIERPAIPALLPTLKGKSLMLDVGANIECTPEMLLQFALMGSVYMRTFLNCERPSVGLLNIGSESTKGDQSLKDAAILLGQHPKLNFIGFVEGNDITNGNVDVVVTDGFTGNVALKSIQGTAHFINQLLYKTLSSSMTGKIAYFIAAPLLKKMYNILNKRFYNGAPFLGLKGISIKSHGSSDALAFSYAIERAIFMVECDFATLIENQLQQEI